MNKQELISFVKQQQIRADKFDFTDVEDSDRADYLANVMYVYYKNLLDELEKLDEPQKVKVPAFVAEWFEEHKHNLSNSLWEFTVELNEKTKVMGALSEFESWFIEHPRAYEFISSMSNGYEVEEEPKYYIQLPGTTWGTYLVKSDENDLFVWQNTREGTPFTEKEIKAIDERYWPFAVPVEKV